MKRLLILILLSLALFVSCSDDGGIYADAKDMDVDFPDMEWYDYDPGSGGGGSGGGGSGGGTTDSPSTSDEDDVTIPDIDMDDGEESNISRCEAGTASTAEQMEALSELNRIRGINGLYSVVYKDEDDVATQECSLIIVANEDLSHDPPTTWKCYSEDAHTGCAGSNIYIRWGMIDEVSATDILYALLVDENVPSLGHRRHFLDPWLYSTSYGRVNDTLNDITGSAMMVSDKVSGKMPGSTTLEHVIVPYPYHSYPAELVGEETYFSFTLIADTMLKDNNRFVDFAGAVITIKPEEGGDSIAIKKRSYDNLYYGVPNVLMWQAPDVEVGVSYKVDIRNVLYNERSYDYEYLFILQE